ncbi:hypothetical protein [Streptomyces chartreusis]|uniref:hypothetical protein n=1 Tax=Streptomyces chartreusis TaxID=1969 RepID=UPI002E19E8AB
MEGGVADSGGPDQHDPDSRLEPALLRDDHLGGVRRRGVRRGIRRIGDHQREPARLHGPYVEPQVVSAGPGLCGLDEQLEVRRAGRRFLIGGRFQGPRRRLRVRERGHDPLDEQLLAAVVEEALHRERQHPPADAAVVGGVRAGLVRRGEEPAEQAVEVQHARDEPGLSRLRAARGHSDHARDAGGHPRNGAWAGGDLFDVDAGAEVFGHRGFLRYGMSIATAFRLLRNVDRHGLWPTEFGRFRVAARFGSDGSRLLRESLAVVC